MIIKKNTPCMFIRVPDYKNYNAIDEHIKILKTNEYVNMIKLGRYPNADIINKITEKSGVIILKTTPKNGNRLFICIVDLKNGKNNINIPQYYEELFEEENYSMSELLKNYFWIKILNIYEVDKSVLDKFETYSTKKKLTDAIFNSRAPQVYGECIESFEIKKEVDLI